MSGLTSQLTSGCDVKHHDWLAGGLLWLNLNQLMTIDYFQETASRESGANVFFTSVTKLPAMAAMGQACLKHTCATGTVAHLRIWIHPGSSSWGVQVGPLDKRNHSATSSSTKLPACSCLRRNSLQLLQAYPNPFWLRRTHSARGASLLEHSECFELAAVSSPKGASELRLTKKYISWWGIRCHPAGLGPCCSHDLFEAEVVVEDLTWQRLSMAWLKLKDWN